MRFLCYYGRLGISAKNRCGSVQKDRERNSFRFRGYGIPDPDIKLEKEPCIAKGGLNRYAAAPVLEGKELNGISFFTG